MGKGKNKKLSKEADNPAAATSNKRMDDDTTSEPTATAPPEVVTPLAPMKRGIFRWMTSQSQGLVWIVVCCFVGSFFGFSIGSGLLTGQFNKPEPRPWRMALGTRIRDTTLYQILSQEHMLRDFSFGDRSLDIEKRQRGGKSNSGSLSRTRAIHPVADPQVLKDDPSHPNIFAVLREAVVREKGGFVHPDLGILQPAPSGAARGLGMVRDTWHQCQTSCMPGLAIEKVDKRRNTAASATNTTYRQEELMIKVPLNYQMTRDVALDTLLPLIPAEVQRKASIHELDDAALLVLLLAHERGFGKYSRWWPYIASLPLEPSCGYSKALRPYLLDSIEALRGELGLDINGWASELYKATQYAEKIANSLARDYGSFLKHPKSMGAVENIQWALCQVASRATAGSQEHGTLRMVPLIDMINHDFNAGGFVELEGEEKMELGDFVDSTELDAGAFTVRSLRYGRRKALKKGQELLVNYNLPHYSALDWFVSLGFVPPERWTKWQKVDSALPRIRRDGPFGDAGSGRQHAASGIFGSDL